MEALGAICRDLDELVRGARLGLLLQLLPMCTQLSQLFLQLLLLSGLVLHVGDERVVLLLQVQDLLRDLQKCVFRSGWCVFGRETTVRKKTKQHRHLFIGLDLLRPAFFSAEVLV